MLIVDGEGGGLARVELSKFSAIVNAAGNCLADVDALIERVFAVLPPPQSAAIRTPITFWSEQEGMGHSVHERIEPREWLALAGSYSDDTTHSLNRLMEMRTAPVGGRLLLWHGEPGTGKTNALRALAHEWRDWCSLEFITDPDRFIGLGMTYMLNVLTHGGMVSMGPRRHRNGGSDDVPDRHKLIVLEDAGELLAADARRAGRPGPLAPAQPVGWSARARDERDRPDHDERAPRSPPSGGSSSRSLSRRGRIHGTR